MEILKIPSSSAMESGMGAMNISDVSAISVLENTAAQQEPDISRGGTTG